MHAFSQNERGSKSPVTQLTTSFVIASALRKEHALTADPDSHSSIRSYRSYPFVAACRPSQVTFTVRPEASLLTEADSGFFFESFSMNNL